MLTGVVNYKQLHVPDPVAVATDAMGKPWLSFYVKIGAILGLSSVILVMLMSQPRIFYAMAKDGLLPPIVAQDPSAVPHALHHDDHHRHDRDDGRRGYSASASPAS